MSSGSRYDMSRHPQSRIRVLLFDDSLVKARLVRSAFAEPGYAVTWAQDVGRACDFVIGENPDVALIRVGPGEGAGWDLLSYLRSTPRGRRMPAVLLSESGTQLERKRSFEFGADRLMVGPLEARGLRRMVHELVDTNRDGWVDLSLSAAPSRWNELLFDPTTRVASLALVFGQYRELLTRGESVSVFCIDLEPLFRLAERSSWDAFDRIRCEFVRGLHIVLSGVIGNDAVIATSHPGSNDFYCFTRQPLNGMLVEMSRRLELEARRLLMNIDADPILVDETAVFVGAAVCEMLDDGSPAGLYNAVREAKALAGRRETRYLHALGDRLQRAIRDGAVVTHFQPIVDLASGRIIGHEALSRGPAGTEIESPSVMFDLARDFRLAWDLQALCIRNVEPILEDLCDQGLLFFNLEAGFIQELVHRGTDVLKPFLHCGSQVVLEVTERGAIRDFVTFRRALHELKQMGFRIAIDDCGSGYATLEAVAELRPDFLKVGHSLFHGVEADPVRRRIVELVARCAETIDAISIAEAIETEEQLSVCRELNIDLGQGYIFAHPAPWESLTRSRPLRNES